MVQHAREKTENIPIEATQLLPENVTCFRCFKDCNEFDIFMAEKKGEKIELLKTTQEWKKLRQERKAQKRKLREENLIQKLEKEQARVREEEQKKAKLEQEEQEKLRLGRNYTVSIALPGSVLDNAQSPPLRTYLAGQIARAAAVFNIDEIVIFDELGQISKTTEGQFVGMWKKGQSNVQLARVLQYLECPHYLRKSFFPSHPDLKYAGLLNALDCPHHMRADEESLYREGVVLNKPVKPGKGSYVDVGLKKEVLIDKHLTPGMRVTVKIDNYKTEKKSIRGKVVAPSTPKTDNGIYWGFTVRLANSLGSVFMECPYKGGYDLIIGTSDKGDNVDSFSVTSFKHAMIVFGGVNGLEASLEADEKLKIDDPRCLFHHYLNTCPNQGSRTIRTEEAMLITMSALRPKLHPERGGISDPAR